MTGRDNPPRILVVDDDERNRRLLDAMLVPEGYAVVEAGSGEQTLELIKAGGIDLVLLDVMMPAMNGFETCERIRKDLGKVDLPIVFITALGDRDSRIQGKQAGGDDFLTKPIDEQELFARVQNLIKVKEYHDLRENQREALEKELTRRFSLLMRTERLATLGTLAAGVGHELNNIAQFFVTAVEILRDKAMQGEPADMADFDRFDRVVDHLSTHALHLLTLGNPGSDTATVLDFGYVVEETVTMLRTMGRVTHVEVSTDLPSKPVLVSLNRTRLEQVMVNLIANAADALLEVKDRRRAIQVKVRQDDTEGRVRCRVEDNGPGIPADKLGAIFELYYTTKPPERGTGLGLPVVRQIVESYGGTLEVESTVGVGTAMTFDLPISTKAPA